MSNLSAFFAKNAAPVDAVEEVVVSDRFKDDEGKPIAWKVKAVLQEDSDNIRKTCIKTIKGKYGNNTRETDEQEYMLKLVIASVVFPDLKDAELQQTYGVYGADNLIKRMLTPGEYTNLVLKVQEVNGYDKDINELMEEAKN
ncbi:phage portal protein [Paenibacillus sp. 2RAB27]|uniref:Phage portal protein n=1 Tax=Paenibacillus plantarum TaxID=2654975 RepID=A0ABX1XKL7_9BACL|nr:phage portal protein [Paenibacillus plantarum]NOU68389.1 phage portal protein [Paenibacillus plantarum]